MSKKLLYLLLPLFVLAACNQGGGNNPPKDDIAEAETPTEAGDGYADVLPSSTSEGIILHAFGWSFEQIKENLPYIKDAGYKAVQTMPVQQPKSGGANWMFFYQPVSFSVATSSPVGTAVELKALCTEAEKYGIDIIADIVFNHMATDGSHDSKGLAVVDQEVENYEPYIYQHQNECFHQLTNPEGSGAITQIYAYGGGLPDLNTANEYVQERSLALLKECIDCGVDGFRFDAAKHIETPQDPQYASSFWTNTLGEAKKYYKQKNNGKELFAYGEILNEVGGGREVSYYTDMMKITDNSYINNGVATAVLIKPINANKAITASYGKGNHPEDYVTWAESHDTYAEEEGDGHTGVKKMMREWAIVASRQSTTNLFFARPTEGQQFYAMGQVGSIDYENEHFGTVNRFHNRFIGAEEYQHAEDETFYVNERYSDSDCGAIVVDLALKHEGIIEFSHLSDGYYFDQLTNKQYHITNGKANIQFDEIGIAVLTKTNNKLRPLVTIDNPSKKYIKSFTVNVEVANATECSYKINGGAATAFTGSFSVKIGENTSAGEITTLEVSYSNGQYSSKKIYKYEKVQAIDGKFSVINFNKQYLEDYDLFIWCWTTKSNYSKDYTWHEDAKVLTIDKASQYTGFLLVLFEKGQGPEEYGAAKGDAWKTPVKQTGDINPSEMFYDAANF